jgi:hypothetical protein
LWTPGTRFGGVVMGSASRMVRRVGSSQTALTALVNAQNDTEVLRVLNEQAAASEIPNTPVYWIIVGVIGGAIILLIAGLIALLIKETTMDLAPYYGVLGALVGGLVGTITGAKAAD